MRVRLIVGVLVILCALLSWELVRVRAQAQAIGIDPVPPRVMTGEDVGFRVEGLRGDRPVGKIVVRVNGEWVEAEIGGVAVRR